MDRVREVVAESAQGELEAAVADVWCELFHRDEIGREENFFELGGNSLVGMKLTEMLAARLGMEVPVVAVFQHPCVRELTEYMLLTD